MKVQQRVPGRGMRHTKRYLRDSYYQLIFAVLEFRLTMKQWGCRRRSRVIRDKRAGEPLDVTLDCIKYVVGRAAYVLRGSLDKGR